MRVDLIHDTFVTKSRRRREDEGRSNTPEESATTTTVASTPHLPVMHTEVDISICRFDFIS